MPESYPYIISNNKLDPIFARIRSAAKPKRFSIEVLKTWGFTASNDRATGAILKELGFLNEQGIPTEAYDRLRDPNDWKFVLGEQMRILYSDLFAVNSNMQAAPEEEVKGAIARVTGKDEESVKRYYATFKTLASLAKFEPKPQSDTKDKDKVNSERERLKDVLKENPQHDEQNVKRKPDFHYNIQIHLPATTDITVYNAIFKSLKEHLGI